MNPGLLRSVARHLRVRAEDAQPDAVLLQRFIRQRDEGAFEELVRRHGGLVWGVCRRTLANPADAEDAFQATFLVLAKNPRAVRKPAALGCFLYGIARRVAVRMRSRVKPTTLAREPIAIEAADPLTVREFLAALDDELARLPERERSPLVLCFLQERTQDEAARQLGVSLSTLKRRLDAGRETLRGRLVRRGVDLTAALAAAGLAGTSASATVVESTARAALGGAGSVGAITVAEGVLRTMGHAKLKAWAAGLVMATTAVGGTGYIASAEGQGPRGEGPVAAQPAPGGPRGAPQPRPTPPEPANASAPGADLRMLELEVKLAEAELSGIDRELTAHKQYLQLILKSPGNTTFEQAGLTATVARLQRESDVARVKLEMAKHRLNATAQAPPRPAEPTPPLPRLDVPDPKQLEFEVRQAEVELSFAKMTLDSLTKQYELLRQARSAAAELQTVEQAMNRAKHDIELAAIRVEATRYRLEQTRKVAPPATPARPPADSPEVRKLREEMLAAAKEAMKLDRMLREQGAAAMRPEDTEGLMSSMYRWSRRVFELETTLSPADRARSARQHFDRMKELETYMVARAQAGAARPQHALDAKFYRLEAEVWVKQAEAGQQSMIGSDPDTRHDGMLLGLAKVPGAEALKAIELFKHYTGRVISYDHEDGRVTVTVTGDETIGRGTEFVIVRRRGKEAKPLGSVTVFSIELKNTIVARISPDHRKAADAADVLKPGDEVELYRTSRP